jgi:integrase
MKDVDFDAGILSIRGSKFGQSRFLPVHPSTLAVLQDYKEFRDNYLNEHRFNSEYFFTTFRGGSLDPNNVRAKFYVMSQMSGLSAKGASKGPRIHDLRHRYAVETLLRWYRAGENVERKLPILSTYLGHVNVKNTYWYLTACPELMGLAVQLLEKRWEEIQ